MKVPDGGHGSVVLARAGLWTSDGQAGMSKEGDSPDYEYRRPLRESGSPEQWTFMDGDVCVSRHVRLLSK